MPSVKEAKARMEEALSAMRREFATVRTGKATPALLDLVRVDAYGTKMPLNQVATVTAPEPSMLVVQPFDRSIMSDVERGIQSSGLGLNPSNDGNVIRVPIPALTEERRREYARMLHKMAEEGRISVRHARRTANDEIKQRVKDHEIGEDEGHRQLDEVQKMTDQHIAQIEELLQHKEQEIMAV
jgi:ribosome recycling factor